MKSDKITLTPEELERIKNDVAFRSDTILRLKIIEETIRKSNGLKPWVVVHTYAIGIIFSALLIMFGYLKILK